MTAKKKAEAKADAELVTVHMLHKSYGHKADEAVEVPQATADRLVKNGHAITTEERTALLEREVRGGFAQ